MTIRFWRCTPRCDAVARGRAVDARSRPFGAVLLFLLLSLSMGGCARWPWSPGPATAPPVLPAPPFTEAAPDSVVTPSAVPQAAATQDTVADEPVKPQKRLQRPAPAPLQRASVDTVRVDSVALRMPILTAAPPDSGAQVTIDMTETERDRLLQSMTDDLAEATAVMKRADATKMTAEQAAALESVRGLVESATAAGERGEIRTAAALAHKARLLSAVLRER